MNREDCKQELDGLIEEVIACIEESRNSSFVNQFAYGLGADAASKAAVLGFSCPPIEYEVVHRPDFHPLLEEYPDATFVNVFRVNDVYGLKYVGIVTTVGLMSDQERQQGEPLPLPGADQTKRDQILRILRSWRRAVGRLNTGSIKLNPENAHGSVRSLEQSAYRGELLRQLLGEPTPAILERQERNRQEFANPELVREVQRLAQQAIQKTRYLAAIPKSELRCTTEDESIPKNSETVDARAVSDSAPRSGDAEVQEVPKRARIAGQQYQQVCESLGQTDIFDDAAYDLLEQALEKSGERAELPSREAWKRNLRTFRRVTGRRKNEPRAGRENVSRSVVTQSEI